METALPPYDSKTAKQIQSFYKLQHKKPDQYRKGEDGSLNIYNKSGVLETSIVMKGYRPINVEERNEMETFRLEKLAALDLLYETERRALLAAYSEYKTSGNSTAVVIANQRVNDIELQRVNARSAVRGVKQIPIPKTNEVMFDEPYETRKLFGFNDLLNERDILKDGIFVLERRNFSASQFYGRYQEGAVGEVKEEDLGGGTEGTASIRLTTGIMARFFFQPEDPQNGILSPLWPVDFIHKETRYASAFQAYEAMRMQEQGLTEVRDKILKTRSVRTIGIITRKYVTPAKNPQALWMAILTDVYAQHPELVEKLLATGQDTLVYADPIVNSGGIGLSSDNKKILDPANWRSENTVGKVLESIRASSREAGAAEEVAPPPIAKKSVISKEQQDDAKKAAIINNRRR